MVTRAAIQRLFTGVGDLEARLRPRRWRAAFIQCPRMMDEGEVKERHFGLFPEDRNAPCIIMRSVHSTDPNDGPDRDENKAWREIARAEMAKHKPEELRRLWATRSIKNHLAKYQDAPNEARFAAQWIGATVAEFGLPDDEAAALMRAGGLDPGSVDVREPYDHAKHRTHQEMAGKARHAEH